jgi:hypothetical protein
MEMTPVIRVYTGQYLNLSSNHLLHVKRGLIRVFTKELPPYAKICVMKLVASHTIFSLTAMHKVSLTQLLTRKAAVAWAKGLRLWVLCISHMWRVFERSLNVRGINTTLQHYSTTLGRSSESNTLLGVHLWKLGRKEIRNRQHSVSIVLPVYVAETTLSKQADL